MFSRSRTRGKGRGRGKKDPAGQESSMGARAQSDTFWVPREKSEKKEKRSKNSKYPFLRTGKFFARGGMRESRCFYLYLYFFFLLSSKYLEITLFFPSPHHPPHYPPENLIFRSFFLFFFLPSSLPPPLPGEEGRRLFSQGRRCGTDNTLRMGEKGGGGE